MSRTRRKRWLRARDRRAILLGLAVLAPAAAYRAGVAPWMQYRAGLQDALVAERDLVARERSAVAGADRDPERDATLRGVLAGAEPWLLGGSSAMAASGTLTRRLTALGRTTGILIQEVQAQEAGEGEGPLEPISIAARAVGDLEGLVRFLHGVENDDPLLAVDELVLQPAGRNDGDMERGQLMNAGLVVTGFRLERDGRAATTASVEAGP